MFVGVYTGMKKMMIIGGGYGARRYVESVIWDKEFEIEMCGTEKQGKTRLLAESFGLSYISFKNLRSESINMYDVILVALPVEVKKAYVEYLLCKLSYHNTLIIEKPLLLRKEELKFYEECIGRKVAVVCQRDFFLNEYYIPYNSQYDIIFPSKVKNEYFNIVNMLPHVFSWLISNDNSLKCVERTGKNTFQGIWRNSELKIKFVERMQDTLSSVNGILYPNVQYRNANVEIVKRVMCFDKNQSKESIMRAIEVSKLIINILEGMKV